MKAFRFFSAFFLFLLVPTSPLIHAETKASSAKTFSFRLMGEPETLDWNRAYTTMETYLLMNLMEGLVDIDQNLKINPALAERWTISDDQKTYTFYLRKDVKWSDGVSLKASDFVTSWKRLLSPKTAASYAYMMYDIEGAEDFSKGKKTDFNQVGVKALDALTLQVKLKRPVASWIYIPSFWVTFPLRADILEKFGESWAKAGRMVTLGPFTLVSYEFDAKVILKANPLYYGKKGNVEEVIAYIVRDASSAMSLFEAGKLDFFPDISSVDLKKLDGRKDLKSFPYLKTGYLGFLTTKFPLSNPHFRRAIAMAMDTKQIGGILHGGQKPAHSFVPPPLLGYSEKIGLPFNVEKAKSELKASGFDATRGPEIELLLPNWDKTITIGEFIQNELKKNLGLKVKLRPFDHKTFRAQLDLHEFGMFMGSWSADYPDPDNFMSIFLSDAGNNRTLWKNALYDQKVLDARGMRDSKTREKNYFAAQKFLLEEDSVIAPLYYEPNIVLLRDRVKGLEINPLNLLNLRKVNLH